VADFQYQDEKDGASQLVNDAIIADPNSPGVVKTSEFLGSHGSRVFTKVFDFGRNATLSIARQFFELSDSNGLKLDGVGHCRWR
jgi:hypothetical protein